MTPGVWRGVSPRLSDLLLSSQSDERLVSLVRSGHERAFAVIVERYRPELQAMARRLCPGGHSEDVVQQAFLSAFSALRSGSEVRHLRGWLYQIVRNAAGRPQPPPCVPLDRAMASGDALEDVVQERALAMSALSEIARLPARQREAMVGTALDGRGRAEIASSMGLSEGAVRQLVHRARTTLRSAVTALTPWPLVRWIAAVRPDVPGPAEVAAGAGAASSGGLALKLSALLASGTFLTGAAVHLQVHAPHRGDARAAAPAHAHGAGARGQSPARAAVTLPAQGVSTPSRSVFAAIRQVRPAANSGSRHGIVRHGRHQETSTRSDRGSEGSPVRNHRGRAEGTGPGRSSGSGGREGHGGYPAMGSWSDGGRGAATQTVSDSHPRGSGVESYSTVEGSSSGYDSGAGDRSASRERSASISRTGLGSRSGYRGDSSSYGGSGADSGSGPDGGSSSFGRSGSGEGGGTTGG